MMELIVDRQAGMKTENPVPEFIPRYSRRLREGYEFGYC
jgi:hypothetical protein